MGINVNPTDNLNNNQPVASPTTQVPDSDGLFGEETKATDEVNKQVIEAQLVQLEAELDKLEAQKVQKEAEKKEIEAQRRSLNVERDSLQKEISANQKLIDKYTAEITERDNEVKKEQEQVEKLKKQYDAKNQEAMELNEKLNEKIAKVLEDSNNNVKTQKEKIASASAEANQKVQSGVIQEDEVAQYIIQKLGGSNATDASEMAFSEINSMSRQIKGLIADASIILSTIGSKETSINRYKAEIVSGNSEVKRLNDLNAPKKKRVNELNGQMALFDKDIASINGDILVVDGKISGTSVQITQTQAAIMGDTSSNGGGTTTTPPAGNQGVKDPSDNATEETPNANEPKNEQESKNPFQSVKYENVTYSNLVDALDAISKNNEQSIETARAQVNHNKQAMRKLFQDIIK